jgi:AraC-like DNA-binding protein
MGAGLNSITFGEQLKKVEVEDFKRSLAEISVAAGFYDQSHFSQSFKNDLGVTPKEFRSAARKSKSDTKRLQPSKTSRLENC